jgi:hypothetical protein
VSAARYDHVARVLMHCVIMQFIYLADSRMCPTRWEKLVEQRDQVDIVEIITWNGQSPNCWSLYANLAFYLRRLWRVSLTQGPDRVRRTAKLAGLGRRLHPRRPARHDRRLSTGV